MVFEVAVRGEGSQAKANEPHPLVSKAVRREESDVIIRAIRRSTSFSRLVTLRQIDSASPPAGLEQQSLAQKEFRPDIEGLRGFTLLAILGFHAAVPGMGGGFIGPDVFFIISGFVITAQLWRQLSGTGTIRLRSFYGGRARRLLPVSVTVGVVVMIVAAALLPPLQARGVMYDGIASALYVGNYWFILGGVDYFAADVAHSPFQHYWTLGVEEQFYLLWPPLIVGTAWLIRRMQRRKGADAAPSKRPYIILLTLITLVSFLLSFVATYVVPPAAYFSLPTRAWDFSIGALLALTVGVWRRLSPRSAAIVGWAGLALLLLACNRLTPETPYPGTAALVPMLGTVLVIGAGCAAPSQGCGRVLGWSLMRSIGRLSYSWYLWHWPVLVFAPLVVGHPLGLAGRLLAVAVSGVLGWLTLRFIEDPLRYSATLRRSPWRSLVFGGAATTAGALAGVVLLVVMPTPVGRGVPAPAVSVVIASPPVGSGAEAYDSEVGRAFREVQEAVAESLGITSVPSNLSPPLAEAPTQADAVLFGGCLRTPFESGQPECAMGDTSSTTTVALVGDSHAAMWTPAFQRVADQRDWRLVMLAKGACPLLDLPIVNPLRRLVQQFQHCEQWREEILQRLRLERPKLVVVSMWRGYGADESLTGFESYGQVWLDSLTRLVRELRGTGATVLVLGPAPSPAMSVPVCLSGHLDDVLVCTPKRSAAVDANGINAERAATVAGGGQYSDLSDLFCTAARCAVIVGNNLVYFDRYHLTLEYSRTLAPVMGALADRALAQD